MPNIRPGWTPKQSVHLRVAAIEFLRVGHQGQQGEEYLDMFFQEWLMIHGMPVLHDELTAEAVLASYKARVVTTIKWHAFAGSNKLQVSAKTRIRTLKRRLKRDLFHLWDLPEDQPKIAPLQECLCLIWEWKPSLVT